MTVNADDIERSLMVPNDIAKPMIEFADAQDAARGDWVGGRGIDQPNAPWPSTDNPILRYLLLKSA